MKTFQEEFVLFPIEVKQLAAGNKIRLTMKTGFDRDIMKDLVNYLGETVILTVKQKLPAESAAQIIICSIKSEVKDVRVRSSRNGENLFLIAEMPFSKEKTPDGYSGEKELIDLQFQDVIINMVITEPDLFQGEDDEDDDYDDDEEIETPDEPQIGEGEPGMILDTTKEKAAL